MSDEPKHVWIIVGAVLAVIGIVLLAVFYRTSAQVEVTQLAWSRAINIERYQTVQESAWSVPQGGRETRHYEAFHHYNRVMTGSHQVCTGTGTSRTCTTVYDYIDVPVYETRYDYDIDRWVVVRTPELHGEGYDATWPDVSDLTTHDTVTLGDERAGMRISRYTVAFTHDYSLDIGEDRWRAFKPGQSVKLILNIFNRPLDVEQPI